MNFGLLSTRGPRLDVFRDNFGGYSAFVFAVPFGDRVGRMAERFDGGAFCWTPAVGSVLPL